jgi:cysteine desulfurase
VINVCKYLETQGFQVTYLPVNTFGLIEIETLAKAIRPQTILISIMHANNEVGTIQPLPEIARLAGQHGIIFHTDAAQSVGKIPTRIDKLGVDLLSVAGHKLYVPKGVGALYIRRGIQLQKLIHGASHERNLRAGTENVPGIVGLGKACEIAKRDLSQNLLTMKKTRDRLYKGLEQKLDGIRLNGHPEKRLPNTLNVGFANLEANTLLSRMEGLAVSAGSACHSGSVEVSPVLAAMKVPLEYAMGSIRFSTGKMTTEEEIDQAVEIVVKAVQQVRR